MFTTSVLGLSLSLLAVDSVPRSTVSVPQSTQAEIARGWERLHRQLQSRTPKTAVAPLGTILVPLSQTVPRPPVPTARAKPISK